MKREDKETQGESQGDVFANALALNYLWFAYFFYKALAGNPSGLAKTAHKGEATTEGLS